MAVVTAERYQRLLYAMSEGTRKKVGRQYLTMEETAGSKAGVGFSTAVALVIEPSIVENTYANCNAILRKLIHRTVLDLQMWFLIAHVAKQS